MKKKNIAFIVVNSLLVIVVGLLLGLLVNGIFATQVSVAAFILLLVTLAMPSLIFFILGRTGLPGLTISILLMASELVINIIFLCLKDPSAKTYGITQACVVGGFLIAYLVYIACFNKEKKD